jgi:hypothetical protein
LTKVVDPDLRLYRGDVQPEALPWPVGTEVIFSNDRLVREWDAQSRRWLMPGNRYKILATVPGTNGIVVKNEVQQELILGWPSFTL